MWAGCDVSCSPRAPCRDYGPRGDRQKTRLMWLVEAMGVAAFREKVGEYMGGVTLRAAVKEKVCRSHAIPARSRAPKPSQTDSGTGQVVLAESCSTDMLWGRWAF